MICGNTSDFIDHPLVGKDSVGPPPSKSGAAAPQYEPDDETGKQSNFEKNSFFHLYVQTLAPGVSNKTAVHFASSSAVGEAFSSTSLCVLIPCR